MAYTPGNLILTSVAPLASGGQRWQHASADTGAQAQVSGFINDGGSRGMRVGDVVEHRNTATNIVTAHTVVDVSATYPGAVDLSNTTVYSTNTDSD